MRFWLAAAVLTLPELAKQELTHVLSAQFAASTHCLGWWPALCKRAPITLKCAITNLRSKGPRGLEESCVWVHASWGLKFERALQKPLWLQQMAYGRGSKRTRSHRVNKPTLKLKTVALSRVRLTHINLPNSTYVTNGEKVTRSILPSWRMTMSARKDDTTGRSNCSVFAIVLPTDTVPTGNYTRADAKIYIKIVRINSRNLKWKSALKSTDGEFMSPSPRQTVE